MFYILMANISFLNAKSNPKTLETILYKFPPNHYCVARDSAHCCSGRAVFPWKIRIQLIILIILKIRLAELKQTCLRTHLSPSSSASLL